MIFPKDFESKVGFAQLRQLLTDRCETRLGKEEAMNMDFTSVFEEVRRRLSCVAEMLALLASASDMPDDTVHDVVPWLDGDNAA